MRAGQRGRRGVVGYVLSAYPVISQTFVRNEVVALREAAVDVRTFTMGGGDGAAVPAEWAGPWSVMTETSWRRAVVDGLWWTARPAALVRLARAARVCGYANPGLVLRGVPTAARVLHESGASVVHTHFGWRGNVPALYVAALLGVPATVTVHATDIFMPHANLGRRLRAMAAVVTVCESNIPYITALGVDRARIHVVPCGIETDVELPPPPIDTGRLLSVGRLVPKKGFDVLLRAFAKAASAAPHATLQIIGDGPLRGELEALADELGIASRVDFCGAMAHGDVLDEVARSSAFVLACRTLPNGESDAMPVAIREAMVRARPVVSTAVAGIPESVDAQVGWLVPQEDVEALASALVEVISDPAEARRRGEAARVRALSAWSLEECRHQLEQVWALAGAPLEPAPADRGPNQRLCAGAVTA